MIPLDIPKSMIYQKQQQQKFSYETQLVIEKEEAYCSHLQSILSQRSSIIIFNRNNDVDNNDNNNNNERINDEHGTDKVVMPKQSLKQQNIEKNQKEKLDSGSMVDDYISSSNNNNTSINEMKILLNQRLNKSIDSSSGFDSKIRIVNGNDHHQDFNNKNKNINPLIDRCHHFSLLSIEDNDNNLKKEQLDQSKESKMMIQDQRKISPEKYGYCYNNEFDINNNNYNYNNKDSITTIRTIKSNRSQQQIKNNKDNPTMIFDYKTVININDKNYNRNISNININNNNHLINRTPTTTTNRLINQWDKCFNNNHHNYYNYSNNLIKNNEAIKSEFFNKNHHYKYLFKSSSSSSLGLLINKNTSWMYFNKKAANFIFHWTLLFLFLLSTLELLVQLNNYDNNYNFVQAISTSSYQRRSSSQQQQQEIYPSSSYQHQKSLPISSSTSIHHRHDRLYPFERAKQLKRNNNNSKNNGIGDVDPTCPNCHLKLNRTQAEQMKLDAIKQQILSKLNLEFRPNITKQQEDNSVAREEAMEIIRKAKLDLIFENHNHYDLSPSSSSSLKRNQRQQRHHRRHRRRDSGNLDNDDQQFAADSVDRKIIQSKSKTSNNNADEDDPITPFYDDNDDDGDDDGQNFVDEYFGKTSEIIIFAEPDRKLNGHILVKLMAPENYYKLNVSKAILWIRLILNRRKLNRMNDENRMKALKQMVKLYVFKVANSSVVESSSYTNNNNGHYQQPSEINSKFFQNHSTFPISNQKQTDYDSNDYDYDGIAANQQQQRLSFQLLAVHKLTKLRHGWIKINLTSAIHEWFDQSLKTMLMQQKPESEPSKQDSRTKNGQNQHQLKLLIDCAGCNDLLDIDLGPNNNKNNNINNDTTNIIRKPTKPTAQHNNNPNNQLNNHFIFQHHQQQLRKRDDNGHEASFSSTSLIDANNNNNNPQKSFSSQRKRDGGEKNGIRNGKNRHRQQRRRYRPFMVLTTESRSKRRSRRHAYNCEDGIRQCCKQSLYVNFEELGWNDWIIYPRGYQANYCMGECVQMRTPDMLAYFHSHVLEEYRIKNPYASITPCCAPTKLSSISLIYFDQNRNIIKADLPKMVVNECGCT